MTLRNRLFFELVCSHVPEPPARVLEVGCGRGELAQALHERGFEITAIDPDAPNGPIFRKVMLEEFSDDRGFDAVVASLSLHHVHDLDAGLGTIASLLPPGGPLVLEEFATERLTGRTARWYHEQRRTHATGSGEGHGVTDDFDSWMGEVRHHHADLHHASTVRARLETRFVERMFVWHPYLYSWALDDTLEPVERELIEEGTIEATGLWYVGERR